GMGGTRDCERQRDHGEGERATASAGIEALGREREGEERHLHGERNEQRRVEDRDPEGEGRVEHRMSDQTETVLRPCTVRYERNMLQIRSYLLGRWVRSRHQPIEQLRIDIAAGEDRDRDLALHVDLAG